MRILGLILAALSIPLIAIDSLAQGTSATEALMIDQHGNVGIGNSAPEATLDVNGTVKVFGEWESKKVNTCYYATTDGFVTAYVFGIDIRAYSRVILYGKTDKTNPPKTTRVTTTWMWTPRSQYNQELGLTMPVRKGDYWEVTADYWSEQVPISVYPLNSLTDKTLPDPGAGGCGNCQFVYFLPFGKEATTPSFDCD